MHSEKNKEKKDKLCHSGNILEKASTKHAFTHIAFWVGKSHFVSVRVSKDVKSESHKFAYIICLEIMNKLLVIMILKCIQMTLDQQT